MNEEQKKNLFSAFEKLDQYKQTRGRLRTVIGETETFCFVGALEDIRLKSLGFDQRWITNKDGYDHPVDDPQGNSVFSPGFREYYGISEESNTHFVLWNDRHQLSFEEIKKLTLDTLGLSQPVA